MQLEIGTPGPRALDLFDKNIGQIIPLYYIVQNKVDTYGASLFWKLLEPSMFSWTSLQFLVDLIF